MLNVQFPLGGQEEVFQYSMMADKLSFFSGNEWACRDSMVRVVGVSGEPVPYRLSNDVFVTVTLLVCLFVACFVVIRSMHALALQAKSFFRVRDRNEDFSLKSESEVKDQFFVILLESVALALLLLCFESSPFRVHSFESFPFLGTGRGPSIFNSQMSYMVLLVDLGIILAYFAYKYGVIRLFNWTFFRSLKRQTWMRGYNLISFGKAVTFLVLVTAVLYTNLPNSVCISVFVALLAVFELLVLYKTKQIFFGSVVGIVPAILYFCTLELIPLLFLWVILLQTNKFLLI